MPVIPDENQAIIIQDWYYDRKVVEYESEMICPKTGLGHQLITEQLHFSKIN